MTPQLAAVNITVKDYLFTLVHGNMNTSHTRHTHVTYPAPNA